MDNVDEGMVEAVARAINGYGDGNEWYAVPDQREMDEARAAIEAMKEYAARNDDNWKLAGMYVDGRAVELNTVTRELRFKEEKV